MSGLNAFGAALDIGEFMRQKSSQEPFPEFRQAMAEREQKRTFNDLAGIGAVQGPQAAGNEALRLGQTDVANAYFDQAKQLDEKQRAEMNAGIKAYGDALVAIKRDPKLLPYAKQIMGKLKDRYPDLEIDTAHELTAQELDMELALYGQLQGVIENDRKFDLDQFEADTARMNAETTRQKAVQGSNGISLMTPDGSVVQIGGAPGASLGVKGKNDLDTRRINTADQLQRINQIQATYDAKFLKSGNRFENLLISLKDKGILPGDTSPEEQASLQEFAEFRLTAFNNLNQTLREMSGAAITPQEAERLTKALPDPGKGVFDGDSPAQFKAKLDKVTEQLRLAMARYNYASATGQVDGASNIVSLDGMKEFMNARGAEIETQLRAQYPDASDEQIRATVRTQIKARFGNF